MKYCFPLLVFSIFFFHAVALPAHKTELAKKIIIIIVNEKGQIFIGRDTLSSSGLATELKQRFWKSFTGTGKIPVVIRVQFADKVTLDTKKVVVNAIELAQKNTLIDICLEEHKKLYEELNKNQQKR